MYHNGVISNFEKERVDMRISRFSRMQTATKTTAPQTKGTNENKTETETKNKHHATYSIRNKNLPSKSKTCRITTSKIQVVLLIDDKQDHRNQRGSRYTKLLAQVSQRQKTCHCLGSI